MQPNLNVSLKSANVFMSILVTFAFIFLAGGLGYLFLQNNRLKTQIASQKQNIVKSESAVSEVPVEAPRWVTAKFGGMFSYDYPAGWNVAELWQDNYSANGIVIAMDPKPINTAPRGGPLATFQINILNGNKNPDETLAQKIAEFNPTNYTDITQEIIPTDLGKVYHYKGKIAGEMLQGQPVESYFFTFNQSSTDPLNQQVIIATMDLKNDPQLSAMLRHVVLSFKMLE